MRTDRVQCATTGGLGAPRRRLGHQPLLGNAHAVSYLGFDGYETSWVGRNRCKDRTVTNWPRGSGEQRMLDVAVTGNVAAGKSTVVQLFAGWGATVIDADRLVREAQAPGSPTLASIAQRFGTGVIKSDGSLDRVALRSLVMGDDAARASLNEIVHPVVQRRRAELAADALAAGDCVLINDIPLLFEVLDPSDFDMVVLVDSPPDTRRARLLRERALSKPEAERLIASQLESDPKRSRSDIVIDNNGTVDELAAVASAAWKKIRARAAAKAAGSGRRLLAVFAHPDDESYGAGGTLARYADAGVEAHLICATSGESTRHRMGRRNANEIRALRREELRRAAEVLGLENYRILDFPDGGLKPDDRAGAAAVSETLKSLKPEVVVTFGPDGVTGHGDHIAVYHWTRNAWSALGKPCRLFYLTYPLDVVAPLRRRISGRPDEEIAARLDVRPWKDKKLAAIQAHASREYPFRLDAPETQHLLDQEWYAAEHTMRPLQYDLYGPNSRA